VGLEIALLLPDAGSNELAMPRIQTLPPAVVAQIAAGEVIERPASVVKELLENSVDAGSSRIDLAVERGGIERICVVDNGCGIAPADLPLAFASHATSKLHTAEELSRIRTLGFRGEALNAIGNVAQVTLQSRPPDQSHGYEIHCDGGRLSPVRSCPLAPGTRVDVRHLFYNVPVRRKFLRTPATEMGHICEVFTRLALAQPQLHLTLRHGGKLVYDVPAPAGLRERLGLFFGADVRNHLYFLEARQEAITLRGYIADPACDRGHSRLQYFFVNGRWVRDRTLSHAVQEAYRGLLLTGRYPVVFLFLELPAELVDVNVHPTKAEVRFRDASLLYRLVLNSIRQRLQAEALTVRLRPTAALEGALPAPAAAGVAPAPRPTAAPVSLPPAAPAPAAPPAGPAPLPPAPPPAPAAPTPTPTYLLPQPPLKAFQLYNSYLVLETPQGMLVIDQHALHERILFEQLRQRVQQGQLEVQPLLIPEPVELTPEQAAQTLEYRQVLAELGLEVEEFGTGTLLLRSYPLLLQRCSPQTILRTVVDYLVSKERAPTPEQLLHDLLSRLACHAAVRAGEPLTAEEIAALVAQRELADNTHHCPHGRPTALLFTREDLERQFRRT
jgi:DNA mismatch repair protein MutL